MNQEIKHVIHLKEQIDSIVAFISGDLVATVFSVYLFSDTYSWIHPMLKLLMSFLMGIFGGLGGLFIKTYYTYKIEPWLKKKLKN